MIETAGFPRAALRAQRKPSAGGSILPRALTGSEEPWGVLKLPDNQYPEAPYLGHQP